MYVSDRTSCRYTSIYLTHQVSPDALWSLRRREIESGLAHKRQTCICYSFYLNDFWRFTIDSKVIANWPSSCEGLQKLLLRACLHGGGGPQVGEVKCGGSPHLSCKRDQIKMRDYMDKRVTPPKRVTSPTWGPPPPCKQALSSFSFYLQFYWLTEALISERKVKGLAFSQYMMLFSERE